MYWIKLWLDILEDDKMGPLPDHLWRRAVECFLMAGKMNVGGRLPSLRRMAWVTRQTEEKLEAELEMLSKLGIIAKSDDQYIVVNYAKRQSAASPARRMRAYRERQETLRPRDENVTGTSPRSTEVLTTTTTSLNTKSSSSKNSETTTLQKRNDTVIDLLQQLDIQDRAQPTRQHAPAIVQQHTVTDILANHDLSGAIAANLRRWAEAKAGGVEIADRPALVWCKIVEGQAPPMSDENGQGFTPEEKALFER